MNYTSRYSFCRTTTSKVPSVTTFVTDETAAKFGFSIENHNHGEKFAMKRRDFKVEFDTLEQAQSWLKGYEFAIVSTSEYK